MAEKIDRKKLVETFHSWCRGSKSYAAIYEKIPNPALELIDVMLTEIPRIDVNVFQSAYMIKYTGWANHPQEHPKYSQAHHRAAALRLGWEFIAELNRGRFEVGQKFPEYKKASGDR